MVLVRDLSLTTFPKKFLYTLPHTCQACGAPTEINETLTILRCVNPICIEKLTQRLVALLKDIGVKNMGESKCRQFLLTHQVTTPYAIFSYQPKEDGPIFEGASMPFSESIYEEVAKKKEMLLWEYVRIGNLPGIRDSARKVFGNYHSLETFYADLETHGVMFIQQLLGGGETDANTGLSVKALEVYHTLVEHKEGLFFSLPDVTIQQLSTPVLNVCISSTVGKPYTSKSDFMEQMKVQHGKYVHINFLNSVTKDCQFLIWAKEGEPTTKVQKAIKMNDKHMEAMKKKGETNVQPKVYIVTGGEFHAYLQQLHG